MADPEVKIKVAVDDQQGSAQLGGITTKLRELVSSIPGVGTALGAVGTAAGVVATAMAGAAKAIHEFAAAERGIAKLDQALGNVGKYSLETREQLRGMAGELSKATAIASGDWLGVITKLIQAGSDPRSIGMDVEAVKNLAGVVGDVETAVGLYSRALNGNFEALGRYGIKVTEGANATDKLKEVMAQAATRGAGVLEAQANTLSGQFSRLGNAISDAFENVGSWIASSGILQAQLGGLVDVLESTADWIGTATVRSGAFNRATETAADGIARYRRQGEELIALTKRTVEAFKAEEEAIVQLGDQRARVMDAEAGRAKSQVDLDVASGKISQQEGMRRKAEIEKTTIQGKAAIQQDTVTGTLEAKLNAVDAIERRLANVQKDLAREERLAAKEGPIAKIAEGLRGDATAFSTWGRLHAFDMENETDRPTGQHYREYKRQQAALDQRASAAAALLEGRQERVGILRGVAGDLEQQLKKARKDLPMAGSKAATEFVVADITAQTAGIQAQVANQTASGQEADSIIKAAQQSTGARGAAGSAAGEVSRSMQEVSALMRSLMAESAQLRREVETLRSAQRSNLNR